MNLSPKMSNLLIICGPTATGKTKLGIGLAKKFNGEIISADSRQVYRYMNVGTGKDLPVNSNLKSQILKSSHFAAKLKTKNFSIGYYLIDGIPVWMLDVVEPRYRFNAAEYKECADLVIEDIINRGKLPIVVGGTGFYIKAIAEEIETIGVEPNWQLREKLQSYKVSELQRMLEDLDLERSRGMNESDRQNPRRLIRAIEIAKWKLEVGNGKQDKEIGSGISENHKLPPQYQASHFKHFTSILFIGLTAPNDVLYRRIDQRVEERVSAGIEEEIQGLLKRGYNWENSVLGTTIAYKEWKDYFEGSKTKEEVIEKWKFDEHDYARRQMTWFKKNPEIQWFDVGNKNLEKGVEKLVRNWYTK